MALSERERQMLEEMEEAIRAEDPRFASQMKGTRPGMGSDRRRIAIGVVGALAGLGLVLLGVNTSIWVGVVGFVLIVASVAYAATPARKSGNLGVVGEDGVVGEPHRRTRPAREFGLPTKGGTGKRTPGGSKSARKQPGHGSFMQRMEQRWEERRRQGH